MKIKEVKELETKDLVEKIENAETALAKMKLNHQITPLENPSQIKAARRDLSLIHISEPTRLHKVSRMPSSA